MARTISASFSKALALIVAGSLASTSALPLAMAQGKGAAAAAPDAKKRDAARKSYQAAEKDYGAGKYAEAYTGFKKANEILPSPHAEYWMAMALDKQGKGEEAAAAFEKLLGHADVSKLGDEKIGQVKARVAELKGKQTGEVNIATTPAGASVSVDGTAQPGETPMVIKLPPGSHTVTITNPGYEKQELKIDVTAGQRVDKNIELKASDIGAGAAAAPAPETPAPAEPAEKSEPAAPAQPKSKVPAYVTLGIAGVATGVGAFFGVKALGAKSDFDDDPTTDNADSVERNALIADMAFGVAITLGVTGIVLLTSGDSAPEKEKAAKKSLPKKARFNVAPYATPNGGGAAARFVF